MVSLRQRNRRAAMRETQRLALPMFVERGFEAVTVDEVARAAGMAASTVFRHFGSKEALVLWDEHEVALDADLGRRLGRLAPLRAIRESLVEALAGRYDADLDFQLARVRYIYATEQLHAAAVEADFRDRAELTRALEHHLSPAARPTAPIIAGASLLALDVALDRWQRHGAARPLGELVGEAFDALAALDTIA